MKSPAPPRPHTPNRLISFAFLLAMLVVGAMSVFATDAMAKGGLADKKAPTSSDPADQETLITAQQMHADQNTNIVTATGRVEIARAGYVLHADKVTYNQKTGIMRAEGHVAMLSPTGEVQFAETEEVTGDMKQAFAQNVGILFPDNSRLSARTAQRYEGRYLVADKGAYTSCNVCKEDPDHPPLWQMRAKEIVHDNVEHNIYYHDATLDFMGLPTFYTPYMSMPDPTVKRRQGFLALGPGYSADLGTFVRVPYYFDIAPQTDLLIDPTFSTEDGAQFAGEYRHRFTNGNLFLSGSFTHTDLISDVGTDEGKQWRGHLFGNFLYNIDNVWRAGTDIAFASDKSYLPRYHITSDDQLTNRAFVEGFKGRDYAGINGYYFEDLRPGTQAVQPFVLPQATFRAFGEPGQMWGGRWSFGGDTLITSRDNSNQGLNQQGPDTRKVSFDTGWERQFISNTGLVSTVDGTARWDNFWADNVINSDGSGNNYDNVLISRPFAQAAATFRYPVARSGDGYQQLVEPIVSFRAAPVMHPDAKQPIEDSIDLSFDETNLFSSNRFTGNDLVDGGSRITYGLRQLVTADNGARVDMFGGQSYSFSRNAAFPALSGLNDRSSDYVGRIDLRPSDWVDMTYGFRLDQSNLAPRMQDARVSVGQSWFRPFARYISADETETTGIVESVEDVTVGFDSQFLKYWHFHIDHLQAFAPDPGARTSNVSLNYVDECFVYGVSASHSDTTRADLNSGTSVMFHVFFKNLGGIHTDSMSSFNFPTEFIQKDE